MRKKETERERKKLVGSSLAHILFMDVDGGRY